MKLKELEYIFHLENKYTLLQINPYIEDNGKQSIEICLFHYEKEVYFKPCVRLLETFDRFHFFVNEVRNFIRYRHNIPYKKIQHGSSGNLVMHAKNHYNSKSATLEMIIDHDIQFSVFIDLVEDEVRYLVEYFRVMMDKSSFRSRLSNEAIRENYFKKMVHYHQNPKSRSF